MVQIRIGMKRWVFLLLLAHCLTPERARISRMLHSIVGDETKHIAYTAALIEKAVRVGYGDIARDFMLLRLRQFCELTLEEVGAGVFEGS